MGKLLAISYKNVYKIGSILDEMTAHEPRTYR